MLKVVSHDVGAFYQHYPRTATVVTVKKGSKRNAMAVAWHCPVSFKPPYYGIAIAPKRYTYNILQETKQFAINFIPWEKVKLIALLGGSSGITVDKFSKYNLSEDKPDKLDVPILKDAYASFECRVIDDRIFGDHAWIIGEVLASHIAQDVFKENGTINLEKVKPSLYLGADLYCTSEFNSMTYLSRE